MMLSDYDNLILELELEKLRNEDLRERLVIASSKLIEIKNLIYQEVDPDKIVEIIKRQYDVCDKRGFSTTLIIGYLT